MGAEIILGGMELGIKAIQIWSDYNAELLALQQSRAAEGKSVTQADVDAALANTQARMAANMDKLLAAKAAQDASQ